MGVATLYGIRNCDTVNRWCTELGWEALLNRSGTTFRKLPSMIKRPVMELGDRLVVSFKPDLYKSIQWS